MRSKILLALAALLLACSSFAASLADRSPFTQGHWWEPSRAGSGFDFFSVGDQSMLVWYTYDEAGRPTWYTAQGTLGANASWPLLRHAWRDGRKAGYEVVGSARPTINNADSITLAWEIGGRTGESRLQPFIVSGVMNELDYTGSWFDPANSGWGLAVTHQGDVLGGVLFTYDAAGAPTWAAGFGREKAGAELHTFTGACPWCPYAASVQRSTGRLQLQFSADTALTVRNELPMAMAAGVAIDGARLVQLSRPASARPADRQLAHFASAEALKAYLASGSLNVRPASSGVDFSPAPPSATPPSFSTTNLQEQGVDEADVVKTDGRFVYALTPATSRGAPLSLRFAEVGAQGSSLSVRGSVQLGTGDGNYGSKQGLFVHGGKVIALTGTTPYSYAGWSISGSYMNGVTHVEIMRAPDAASLPTTLWRARIDGHLLTSRRIGDRLYLVSRFVPFIPGFVYGAGPTPQNLGTLAATRGEDLLPKARVNGGDATPLLDASSVYLPRTGVTSPLADLIVVTAIDLASPRIVQSLGVAGSIGTVYVSSESLYLASARYQYFGTFGAPIVEPPGYTTDIHHLRLGANGMAVVGSGSIEGHLGSDIDKSAFRMSEHAGKLRVVSASMTWWATSRNRITILEPSPAVPGILRTVSYLPNTQRPQTLGKPGEVLYGTRFAGERLYAVTFKNIDPLYVVDLSNPADPRIAGELQMPGFSEYLHPLPNGLLLGFGKDAKPSDIRGDGNFAWYQGLQLSLFDVRDPARPREMQRLLMGKRGSDSPLLRDHHALSTLARADGTLSLALPAQINDGPLPLWGSGDSATYPWVESGLLRFEVLGSTAADARLVQLASLITHRNSGAYQAEPYPNPTAAARSVLFPAGLVYVSDDKFWHRDAAGTATGPF